jgi:hypothetical protein
MNERFAKSESGRSEIKSSTRKLSRPARNLLLIIDGSRDASSWVHLVHGASEKDLQELLSAGLIEVTAAPEMARVGRTSTLAEALNGLSYEQLYALLTGQARDRLGLIKGFKTILDLEKCSNIDELRALALRFFDQVKQHQGEEVARTMRLALGAAA